jgi:iron complex outermembrane receptor protein
MNAGFTGKSGVCKIFYDYSNHKLGLVEEEAVSEIINRGRKNEIFYQEFNTRLLSSQNNLYLGKYKLDVNAAFQDTELIHFAEKMNMKSKKLSTLTYEAKAIFPF